MELFLDCLPCLHRQALEAARIASADEATQAQIMDEAIKVLARRQDFPNAPAMAEATHQVVRRLSGTADPYHQLKQDDIATAAALEPRLWDYFESQGRSLSAGLRVAAIGNIMDAALVLEVNLDKSLERELSTDFARSDLRAFNAELESARRVLVIADNAGEASFDKVLLAALAAPERELIYATRAEPIINDLTPAEARQVGMEQYATLISSGSTVPGTILSRCSAEFQELFHTADLVISKGQGNFESLSDSTRCVYFLLKVKCPIISRAFDTEIGRSIFLRRCGSDPDQ